MPRTEKNGPGHTNLGVASVQGVVGAMGVNGTVGGCGWKGIGLREALTCKG